MGNPMVSPLLSDLYQFTMACAYWKSGRAEQEAVFQLFYRRNPFGGGYAVACGLAPALEFLSGYRFSEEDLAYLAGLSGADGKPLFPPEFLRFLGRMERLPLEVAAIPEGTVVFPHEPLLRVRGPIFACQLVETALLNLVNFQTLVATKAARICQAARGEPVLEFGLRRAQGPDGALGASRAAYVGGCAATSNVLAGKLFGIPVRGTHAHSWVMCFEDEPAAFEAYAEAMPNNCIFLVDTYDTLEGVRNAVAAGRRLRERGHRLLGIRLDSGDLAFLSIEARKLLDAAGFRDAAIVASNDLDENIIASLKEQGAAIAVWGVGTRLATAYDEPALGGVYKLAAVRMPDGAWRPTVKLSEQAVKTSIPGLLQVRRFSAGPGAERPGEFLGDLIYDETSGVPSRAEMADPLDATRRKVFPAGAASEDLLAQVLSDGRGTGAGPPLAAIRARAGEQLARCHAGVRRFVNPHQYPVGLESGLHELRRKMILEARGRLGQAAQPQADAAASA